MAGKVQYILKALNGLFPDADTLTKEAQALGSDTAAVDHGHDRTGASESRREQLGIGGMVRVRHKFDAIVSPIDSGTTQILRRAGEYFNDKVVIEHIRCRREET